MKINTLNLHPVKCALALALLAAGAAQAQTLDIPSYRGQAGTESAYWYYSFTNAVGGANTPMSAGPDGSVMADATITQTATTTPPSSNPMLDDGGIYGFFTVASYVLDYPGTEANFPDGIGNVTFQFAGSTFDLNSVLLNFGDTSLSPTAYTLISGDADDGTYEWSWNLPLNDAVNSFSISFNASGQHSYLEGAALDIAPFNVAPAPEPSTLALAGVGLGLFGVMARRMKRNA